MMKTKTLFLSFALLLCQLGFAKQIMSSERLIEYSKFESSIIPSQDNSDWLSSHHSGKKNEKIEKVEPAFWWSGMKNTRLQLMVYGSNIATYKPEINHPGVVLKEVCPMESPNYLVLYLDVKDAAPGKFQIEFVKGKRKLNYTYELKERQRKGEDRIGFNSSDVVYLLMPDRFANGDESNDYIQMKYPYTVNPEMYL